MPTPAETALAQAKKYHPDDTTTFGLLWVRELGQDGTGTLLIRLLDHLPQAKPMNHPKVVIRAHSAPAIKPPMPQRWTGVIPCKETVQRCLKWAADKDREIAVREDRLKMPMDLSSLETYYFYFKEAGYSFTRRQMRHLAQVSTRHLTFNLYLYFYFILASVTHR